MQADHTVTAFDDGNEVQFAFNEKHAGARLQTAQDAVDALQRTVTARNAAHLQGWKWQCRKPIAAVAGMVSLIFLVGGPPFYDLFTKICFGVGRWYGIELFIIFFFVFEATKNARGQKRDAKEEEEDLKKTLRLKKQILDEDLAEAEAAELRRHQDGKGGGKGGKGGVKMAKTLHEARQELRNTGIQTLVDDLKRTLYIKGVKKGVHAVYCINCLLGGIKGVICARV